MTELLSPAGDFEKLKFACLYGADAVYIGGKDFSLRANATNFSLDEIKLATEYTHNLNKKLYVTVNIVFHDKDIVGLKEYLIELNKIKVDGIMISDPLILDIVRDNKLNLNCFLSTQVSTLNYESAKFWKEKGIKRIVLAREAMKEDIKRIKKETDLEIECFIHGAMCTSISGKCVMSNYTTNRDSNRGGCAQICRWAFDTDKPYKFSMTPKDLNMVSKIKDMIEDGVDSFKIEGRMRSIYYIATVVYTYRQIIDKISTNSLTDEYTKYYVDILNRCANRESTNQFYDKFPGIEEQYFISENNEVSNQDFLGLVLDYDKEKGIATIEQRNYFEAGTVVEFFGPNTLVFQFKIEEIYDENMNKIDVANHAQMIVKMPINREIFTNDIMRIKSIDF